MQKTQASKLRGWPDQPCQIAQMSPIQQGLRDAHPYVRRTAVMGVLKVYHLDESAVRNAGDSRQPTPPNHVAGALRGALTSRHGSNDCFLNHTVLQACSARCRRC